MRKALKMHGISCFVVIFLMRLTSLDAVADFYSNTVTDIEGNLVSLEKYRGKALLVVNVASECGFTDKHYRGLVRAKEILGKDDFFEILAFPCNQFGAQEPKGNADILEFAKGYKVNFPMFAKINVLESNVPPMWSYLIEKSGHTPNWNFWKYLVDQDGNVLGFWGPWSDLEEIFSDLQTATDSAREVAAARKAQRAAGAPTSKGGPPSPIKPPTGGVPASGEPPVGAPEKTGPPTGPREVKPPSSAPSTEGKPKPPAARGFPPPHEDL